MFAKWLKTGLSQKGKTARELASLLGYNESTVSRMAKGQRKIFADEVPIISAYICTPPPFEYNPSDSHGDLIIDGNRGVQVMGQIDYNHWAETIKPSRPQTIPHATNQEFAGLEQKGFELRHDISGFNEGAVLNTVSFSSTRETPLPGDYIVTKVQRHEFIQVRLIVAKQKAGKVVLIDAFNNEEYTLDASSKFEFLGLVIGAYYNFFPS